MECRRTNPQSSLPTSPSHTPTYNNAIPMDSDWVYHKLGNALVLRSGRGSWVLIV